ncbi:MAG TPA: methyltransferase domain-containing protein [Gemmatimonadales bacterium]|nr:methyltransferase domain-containing protein [Gemmatimonadales bacterium]
MKATTDSQHPYWKTYSGSAPENYERYFVPQIGAPLAADLLEIAALRPGERVLDVACGTGIVTRLAAQRVGNSGMVAGLDVNAGMLAVARSVASPAGAEIRWYETSAEAIPLPEETFDVVVCQLGLQFVPDKGAAVREMWRVLVPEGRLIISVAAPNPVFEIMDQALRRHVGPAAAAFVQLVFSLHDPDEIERLFGDAGLRKVAVGRSGRTLRLPPPEEFLWQYIHSTPLAGTTGQLADGRRAALEREVVARWQPWLEEGALTYHQDVIVATGIK